MPLFIQSAQLRGPPAPQKKACGAGQGTRLEPGSPTPVPRCGEPGVILVSPIPARRPGPVRTVSVTAGIVTAGMKTRSGFRIGSVRRRAIRGARRRWSCSAGNCPAPGPISKRHAYAYTPPPDNAAFLSHIAVEKLKTLRQRDHRKYLEARAARGVIDQFAGDRRRLRAHDDLGLACRRTRGPNALV
jgi:hypothetical protein